MQRSRLALATHVLQSILVLIFFGNLMVDSTSLKPRLVIFFYSLVGSLLISPRYLLWLLAPCLWLEIPTLRLGFPNQFLSDILLLGWTCGVAIRFRQRFSPTENWVTHPYLSTLLAVVLTATFYFLITLVDANSLFPDGFSKKKMFLSLLHGIFNWDVTNPLHNASVIVGYSIQLLFIATLMIYRTGLCFSAGTNYSVLALGASVNALYGIGQLLWPTVFPAIFTVDKGGLLQNGNHLSFVCGLALIGLPIIAREAQTNRARILISLLGAILVSGMIIGRGRLPWIAFATAATLYGTWSLSIGRNLRWQHLIWPSFFLLGSAITLRYSGAWDESAFFTIFQEIPDTIRIQGWTGLFSVGGRGPHFLTAVAALADNPLFGIGLDSFFSKTTHSLAIHSLFFQWLVGMGILGAIPWVSALLVSSIVTVRGLISIKQPSVSLMISMLALLYIAMAHLGDVFVSYRSLFTFCSLVATAFWVELQTYSYIEVSHRGSAIIFMSFAASILAFLSTLSPQSIALSQIYAIEHDKAKEFSWNGIYRVEAIPAGTCTRFEVTTPIQRDGQILKAAIVRPDEAPPSYLNRIQLAKWESQNNTKKATVLLHGQWLPVCACSAKSEPSTLYLSSTFGEILSASREEFGYDPRFIGFGITTPANFANTDDNFGLYCKNSINLSYHESF